MTHADHHLLAARAVARGDPLTALNAVAGDDGAHARALRGIASAQLQEYDVAERELRAAADAFVDEPVYRARALAALAEIAAARRELGTALDALAAAADDLASAGDERNAAWTRLVRVRILLLVGALDEARDELGRAASTASRDPVLSAAYDLARAATSAREFSAEDALSALDHALGALSREDHPLLAAEIDAHREALSRPLARVAVGSRVGDLALPALARIFRGGGALPLDELAPDDGVRHWLVVDAIARRVAFCGEDAVDLSRREVLFTLLLELARAWPAAVATDDLVASVFEGPAGDESHRDRCRVEIARLRKLLPPPATVDALGNAWRLAVPDGAAVVRVSLRTQSSTLSALLGDGQAWAARDLALAIGASQRSVQRALAELAEKGGVAPVGRARARRWIAPGAPQGIASQMFLVSLLDPRDPASRSPETEESP